MKILLNGATRGTNFGDYLYSKIFQDYLSEKIGLNNIYWYKSLFTYSDFFSEKLDNQKKCKLSDIDGLIYIPGGYFCGNDNKIRHYLSRYLSYFHIGIQCIIQGIPYAIIGVEVGLSKSRIIQFIQKIVLKYAKMVIVRNNASFQCVKSLGICNAVCLEDAIFTIEPNLFENVKLKINIPSDGKILFFHLSGVKKNNIEKLISITNLFIAKHSEYIVLISADQCVEKQHEQLDYVAHRIKSKLIIKNYYDDPLSLCKIISKVDLIITTKLHVGVVGAKLGKSVVSFSGHTEKIKRLYEQIGESKRSYPLNQVDINKGVEMLEKFHNIPIKISNEIISKAKENLNFIDVFLKLLEKC